MTRSRFFWATAILGPVLLLHPELLFGAQVGAFGAEPLPGLGELDFRRLAGPDGLDLRDSSVS